MIAVVDTVEVTPGKRDEAIELVKKWAAAAPSAKAEVFTPETGEVGKVVLIRYFGSHAERLRVHEPWQDSRERKALMKELRDTQPWVLGKRVRTFYKVE